MNKEWLNIGGIVLIAGFIMFFRLGALPLFDPDEPVYAETALEMLASGDFISPRIYGEFWYDKPPMYYWLAAGMTALLGPAELAARMPSALMGIAGVLAVYRAGKYAFGQRTGCLASLLLATSIEYFYLGKAAVTDITLCFFFSAALFAYAKKRYLLMYACMGLAALTKGPVGVALPTAIVALHLLLTKNRAGAAKMRIAAGAIILSIICAPWYALMYRLHGMDFINTFLGFHNITRFLRPEHASGTVIYYYIPVLLVGFFPWTVYLVQAVKSAAAERNGETGNFLTLLLIWIGAVFAFFSLSQTKLISYILPMYPPMALVVGWYIDRALRLGQARIFIWGTAGFALLGGTIAAALCLFSYNSLGFVLDGALSLAALFSAMTAVSLYAIYKKRGALQIAGFIGGMTCVCAVLMIDIFPAAAHFTSVKNAAIIYNREYAGEEIPVYVDKFYRPGFSYYTGVFGEEIDTRLPELMETETKAFFLVKENDFNRLPADQRDRLLVLRKQAKMILAFKP